MDKTILHNLIVPFCRDFRCSTTCYLNKHRSKTDIGYCCCIDWRDEKQHEYILRALRIEYAEHPEILAKLDKKLWRYVQQTTKVL